MKTKLLSLFTLLCIANTTNAQVLYSEDFDNLTLGNVGTDYTGKTAGQGGWHTLSFPYFLTSEANNNYFNVVSEPGKGKVLQIKSLPSTGINYLQKRDIDTYWSKRSPGNDILKIEFDFYTGPTSSNALYGNYFAILSDENFDLTNKNLISSVYYRPDMNSLNIPPPINLISPQQFPFLKDNTWYKFIFYIDYSNQISYFFIPSLNLKVESYYVSTGFPLPSTLIIQTSTVKITSTSYLNKYDNFVISAVDKVPLNVQDFISSKFNLYPNPSNDIVNITNNENIGVEKVDIFDISGKLVQTKTFKKEAEIQLNISDLASGTYMFHISTTEGTAVKKVAKK